MNKELNYNERKEWARMIYTTQDQTNKDIALAVGVDEATIRCWVQESAWNDVKRSLLTTKAYQLNIYYKALEQLNDKLSSTEALNVKDLDLMVKYTAAIKNLETAIPVSNIIEVSELFLRWLRKKDLNLTKKLVVQFDAWIKEQLAA